MSERAYIIAEAGVNHNGDLDRALAMVDAAAAAGADAVKFQTFRPAALVTRSAPQAEYQIRNEGDSGSQLAMLQRLVLSDADHHQVMAHCSARGIDFMSSPFDTASARFLIEELQLPRLKLGSGELTNAPLLLKIANAGRALILSTGMATLDEIRAALGVLAFGYLRQDTPTSQAACRAMLDDPAAWAVLRDQVALLHCTTEYPCPLDQVNLRAMDTLREGFGLPVGYSDHTLGIQVSVAAAARGATILEKHFTLDRSLPGPDHVASLEPDELTALVTAVREVSQALGSAEKTLAESERKNQPVARKSLVAAAAIRQGELFSADNLTVKRPGTGRSPMDYWDLLGTPAARDYQPDELI
jgi:N-acetylneuraminate synthase